MQLRGLALAMALGSWSGPALAHLSMTSPPSRYGGEVLKVGPCGKADGQRSANVITRAPGSELELVWDEYVNHPGHFRVAFDDDGDDDFIDPVCISGCNSRTPEFRFDDAPGILLDDLPDTPAGGTSRVTVTLPDVECDNCTLQVIQVMYDKPPYTTPGNDIYYQCVDLVLTRNAPAGMGGAGGATTGTGGAPGQAGSTAGEDAGAVDDEGGVEEDDGGCTLSRGRPLPGGGAAVAALALGAVAITACRRRARSGRRRSSH